MKKLLSLLLLVSISFAASSQTDTITINHKRYSTTFDRTLHYPVLVKWTILKSDIDCTNHIPRDPDMSPDPLLAKFTDLHKYYVKSGYDKGHNMPAADNGCDKKEMDECFYFSNMTPQTPQLNRITWENLEVYCRNLAEKYGKINVWCGSFGDNGKLGIVSIPKYCWKIIRYNGKIEAYLFPNSKDVNKKEFTAYASSVQEIKKDTGLKLEDVR